MRLGVPRSVYLLGGFAPGLRLKSGVHLQGVNAEEFAARVCGQGIRSMSDAVISLQTPEASEGSGSHVLDDWSERVAQGFDR